MYSGLSNGVHLLLLDALFQAVLLGLGKKLLSGVSLSDSSRSAIAQINARHYSSKYMFRL